jgi:hypothetical protein
MASKNLYFATYIAITLHQPIGGAPQFTQVNNLSAKGLTAPLQMHFQAYTPIEARRLLIVSLIHLIIRVVYIEKKLAQQSNLSSGI